MPPETAGLTDQAHGRGPNPLPTVKVYAARQHMAPYAAACAVLEATDGT